MEPIVYIYLFLIVLAIVTYIIVYPSIRNRSKSSK